MCSKGPDGRPAKKNTSQRAAIAARFKVLCLDTGLKVPDVARTLQVTERTVYAWFLGKNRGAVRGLQAAADPQSV
ncbi:helix-turn-helix domain-containing protein [Variovorax sp. GB1R11]|uniref:helix-turn-helix domain-containing protein n=1 Tax=Variovorax sp. GB1R11 TaxID=3443741 RepID=UPI003F48DC71